MSTTTSSPKIGKINVVNLSEVESGDIFSEQSHYTFDSIAPNGKYKFLHLESDNMPVYLDKLYVTELLQTADQFMIEIEVGLEDKKWTAKQISEAKFTSGNEPRVGDVRQKGILSIWDDINSQQVFTVNFNKIATETSDKKVNELKDKQLQDALSAIAIAAKAKKGVATAAAKAIKDIQDNPVTAMTKGDERTLRGYKVEFSSINGAYGVVDMEIALKEPHKAKRQVYVRNINWLGIGGVKYIVK